MKKYFVFIMLSIGMIVPLASQEKKETPAEKPETGTEIVSDQVYREITIENFENSNYTDKDVSIRVTKEQKAGLNIRDQYPAPIAQSKKYLGVKLYGRRGDVISIKPVAPLEIKDHCQSISVWAYGKNFSGELSFIVQDANKKTHRLILGKLNFLGWRKLTVKLTKDVAQEDKYLSQPRKLQILKIIYSPGNTGRLPLWQYFYLDDITAKVRSKYEDKQTDTW